MSRVTVLVFQTTVPCNAQRTSLISWGRLNTCWPLESSERIPCFALLGSTAFVLPLKVLLSQPPSFHVFTLLTPFHISLSGEWVSECLCWTGANPLQLVVQMWISHLTLMLWGLWPTLCFYRAQCHLYRLCITCMHEGSPMLEVHWSFRATASPQLQNNVLLHTSPLSVFPVSLENFFV